MDAPQAVFSGEVMVVVDGDGGVKPLRNPLYQKARLLLGHRRLAQVETVNHAAVEQPAYGCGFPIDGGGGCDDDDSHLCIWSIQPPQTALMTVISIPSDRGVAAQSARLTTLPSIATAIPGPVTPRCVSSWASVTGPLTVISSLLIEIFMQVYEIKVKTVGDDGLDGKINQHANYRNRYPASRKTGKR